MYRLPDKRLNLLLPSSIAPAQASGYTTTATAEKVINKGMIQQIIKFSIAIVSLSYVRLQAQIGKTSIDRRLLISVKSSASRVT